MSDTSSLSAGDTIDDVLEVNCSFEYGSVYYFSVLAETYDVSEAVLLEYQ